MLIDCLEKPGTKYCRAVPGGSFGKQSMTNCSKSKVCKTVSTCRNKDRSKWWGASKEIQIVVKWHSKNDAGVNEWMNEWMNEWTIIGWLTEWTHDWINVSKNHMNQHVNQPINESKTKKRENINPSINQMNKQSKTMQPLGQTMGKSKQWSRCKRIKYWINEAINQQTSQPKNQWTTNEKKE